MATTLEVASESRPAQHASAALVSLILLGTWLLATMSLWFFAFYSIPVEAPDWVRRAQVACFGSDESGLPGPAGWMLLILSPLMFLAAMCLAFGDEVAAALRHLRQNLTARIGAFMLTGLVLIEATWIGASIQNRLAFATELNAKLDTAVLAADYPRSNEPAPSFTLINQRGEKESLSDNQGKPVLLTFVFAHCQAICPALVKTVSLAASDLGPARVHAMFITLDPWRDTPAALPGLLQQWGLSSDVSLFSGDPTVVTSVLDAYKVPRERNELTGDVAHPALVYVIGTGGELAYTFNNPSVEWLKEAVNRLAQ